MEYLVSNTHFSGARKFGNLYVKGKVLELEDKVAICEGYILDEEIENFEQYIKLGVEENHIDGVYEILEYDLKSDRLLVKGDYNGL